MATVKYTKYLLVLVIIGVIEIVLVSKLHNFLGLEYLIYLYLATTACGFIFACIYLPYFKKQKAKIDFSNKFPERAAEGKLPSKDVGSMKHFIACASYVIGCVLIAIPGMTTDLLGVLMILPPVGGLLATRLAGEWGEI